MKTFAFFVLVMLVISIIYYNKTFKTVTANAEKLSYSNFLNSDIVSQVNSMKTTWVAGYNKRWDGLTQEEIQAQMGVIMDRPSSVTLPVVNTVRNDIPDTFDPRSQWSQCDSIKEVRDQSNCGSCWTFGAAESFTDRWCIFTNGQSQDRLSPENLLTCCDTCGYGCNGGWPVVAWDYFVNVGIVTGYLYNDTTTCQPYHLAPCDHHTTGQYQPCPDFPSLPAPACQYSCQKFYSKTFADDIHTCSKAYTIGQSIEAIQTELMTYGPAEASFFVYDDFLTYKSGVYQHVTGDYEGGHAIKIMGWGVENDTPYWLCANSWNSDWGEQGFFKIVRGTNECGIEHEVVAGIPNVPQQYL